MEWDLLDGLIPIHMLTVTIFHHLWYGPGGVTAVMAGVVAGAEDSVGAGLPVAGTPGGESIYSIRNVTGEIVVNRENCMGGGMDAEK